MDAFVELGAAGGVIGAGSGDCWVPLWIYILSLGMRCCRDRVDALKLVGLREQTGNLSSVWTRLSACGAVALEMCVAARIEVLLLP